MSQGVILPIPEPISDRLATADADQGAIYFEKNCTGCHLFEPELGDSTGPNLWNVVGRDKASRPFPNGYSKTLLGLEGNWTYEDLNTFLSGPAITTPGTKMDSRGAPDETDRANLIAYLRTLSDDPVPLL
ncbi:c-type cytochrome [Defluviimonas sp. WL0024]|uniref:C-type cytochrome n=1 Tax=Albidovulum salinarum TaxID=2984153 RepID=A0ABT2WZ78_9RHOB|nr:c-type cytochrome [Defluviimonas sp. WL0024]MCU9846981.1 c-type cytochrome [Defluviimonas sp. WL0024]